MNIMSRKPNNKLKHPEKTLHFNTQTLIPSMNNNNDDDNNDNNNDNPAEHSVKMKESKKKIDQYLDLTRQLKKL